MTFNIQQTTFILLLTLLLASCSPGSAADPKPDFSAYEAAQKARASWLGGGSTPYYGEEDDLDVTEEEEEDYEEEEEEEEAADTLAADEDLEQ